MVNAYVGPPVKTYIGVDKRRIAKSINRVAPGYMPMGSRGMAEVFVKAMLCNWMVTMGVVMAFTCALVVGVFVGLDALRTSAVAQSQFTAWFVMADAIAMLVAAPLPIVRARPAPWLRWL